MAAVNKDHEQKLGAYNAWKQVNPTQGANFADWIRGGSPNGAGSALAVTPTGADLGGTGGIVADSQTMGGTVSAAANPTDYNINQFWNDNKGLSRAGFSDNPAEKQKNADAIASDNRVRGRAATYFSNRNQQNSQANLFKRSLLGS